MCLKEIKLHTHNLLTIVDSIVNVILCGYGRVGEGGPKSPSYGSY